MIKISQANLPKTRREWRRFYVDARLDASTGTPDWYVIGRDNEDLTRDYSWNEDDILNVLGEFASTNTITSQTITADPFYARRGDAMSLLLFHFDETGAELDDIKRTYAEAVITEDNTGKVTVYAFVQDCYILIQSTGGAATDADNIPFNIKLTGSKRPATYDPTTEEFTEGGTGGGG